MSLIRIRLECAQCDKFLDLNVFEPQCDETMRKTIIEALGRTSWILQDNGQMDTYCSKRCAK